MADVGFSSYLEKEDTPILAEVQIYHNCIRPHMTLDGKPHAELAGIKTKCTDSPV